MILLVQLEIFGKRLNEVLLLNSFRYVWQAGITD